MFAVRPALWTAAALLVLSGCSHAARIAKPHPSPAGRVPPSQAPASVAPGGARIPASPAPVPARSATPAVSASPAASLSPIPLGTRTISPPPAVKHVPRLPPGAPPQILDVTVSQTSVEPGDRVFGRVVTTSNVASVQARIGGYAVSLVKVGVGRFELAYTVGPLPWFVRGNFTMEVIARNTHGDTATRAIPLTVR